MVTQCLFGIFEERSIDCKILGLVTNSTLLDANINVVFNMNLALVCSSTVQMHVLGVKLSNLWWFMKKTKAKFWAKY